MANLKEAFEYAAQNPDSDFAKNFEKLAGSGALDQEAKKFGLDMTPFKPETTMDKVEQVAKGAVSGVLRGTVGATQDIGKGVLGLAEKGIEAVTGRDIQSAEGISLPEPKTELEKTSANIAEVGTYLSPLAPSIVRGGTKVIKTGLDLTQSLPKNLSQKALDFISADPEKKVQTILKESKAEELDNFLTLAEKASIDPRAATPFEVVGNKLADTTKILQTKLSEIGKAKSDIITPLREGLDSFTKETKPLINNLTSLKNSFTEIDKGNKAIVQSIMDDAKTIKTKLDADKFIDKVQDAIFSGNKSMTIAKGSALDKQLRGIVGEYNNTLKSSLPKEYAQLNKQYSELIDSINTINSSLGEVVEGVPVRGASLIKQFFSPSGTKAKEIFEFVKKETGGQVDLAKDSTLAKFSMDLFDDPRSRSLLQGIGDIPTTLGGAATKVIEKIGGEKLQGAMRKSTIKKAKETTKKSFNQGTIPQIVKSVEDAIGSKNRYQYGYSYKERKNLLDNIIKPQLEKLPEPKADEIIVFHNSPNRKLEPNNYVSTNPEQMWMYADKNTIVKIVKKSKLKSTGEPEKDSFGELFYTG